jgi:hypothetical protein
MSFTDRQPSTGGTRRGSEAAAPEAGGPCGWLAGSLEPKIYLTYRITQQNTLVYSLSHDRLLTSRTKIVRQRFGVRAKLSPNAFLQK